MTATLSSVIEVFLAGIGGVIALAMMLVVLWQAPRQRDNQLMALYMFSIFIWGSMNFVAHIAAVVGDSPVIFLKGLGLTIGVNAVLLFVFVSHYARMTQRRWVQVLTMVSLLYLVVAALAVEQDLVFEFKAITQMGLFDYELLPIGYVAFGFAYALYLISFAITWKGRNERAGKLFVGTMIPLVGLLAVPLPIIGQYPIDVLTAALSTIFFARAILQENLFNPLAELNKTLADSNAKLLLEERQRLAELAIVGSVGQALSDQLEVESVVSLMGERISEIFNVPTITISLYDQSTNMIRWLYAMENRRRTRPPAPRPLGKGFTSHIIATRQPLVINQDYERTSAELGAIIVGTPSKSYAGVPIIFGDQVVGVLSLEDPNEENAFPEAEVRLLMALTSTMGIAIKNANLYSDLQRRKQHFESLVLNSPVAIVLTDSDRRIISWNPSAENLFGYMQEEVLGRDLDLVVASDEMRAQANTYSTDILVAGHVHAITKRQRKDGSLVDVEALGVSVALEEGQLGMLVIYHDITDLERARVAAEEANRAKSQFVATMSHEIRTPMNAIIGMSSLLLSTPLSDDQREFAEVIRGSGDALLTIINDILDFSKIEAGKMGLEHNPFDLRNCVEGALDLVSQMASQKGLDLAYFMAEHVPSVLIGDVTRLRQVLINLLNNAVKFTEHGDIFVNVSVATPVNDASVATIHISVRDTGIGIPADRIDKLFQLFTQVDPSTTRKYGGTGLGLAISKRLVELMGGRMWAESHEGAGTTFHFTVQMEIAPLSVADHLSSSIGSLRLKGKHVLLVDDNATHLKILALNLQAWGIDPSEVVSSQEALQRIEKGDPFDLAIIDLQMSDMSGVTLAEKIRKYRDAQALPLISVASLGRRNTELENALFAAHMTKPLKPSHVFDTLMNVVAQQPVHVKRVEAGAIHIDPEMALHLPLRILLAEDNVVNQKLALRLLQQMGYRADIAANGLEVLQALQRQKYDVILMDVQMPEMDGLEATRKIREEWKGDKRPHIVAMTANAMREDREICLAAGMDDYIAKPIRTEELMGVLGKIHPAQELAIDEQGTK